MTSTLRLTSLPSETLLLISSFLSPEELQVLASSCRLLRAVATGDGLWKPIVHACLESSPPARSPNIHPLTNPPPPWDPAFGLVSSDRNPASRERWFAAPPDAESGEKETLEGGSTEPCDEMFPGASSFYDVYWSFIHHLRPLLGWWMGDLPSYGVIVRIVFDPQFRDLDDTGLAPEPAFVCEKVHLVNRLLGMGASALHSPWMEATSFDVSTLLGMPGRDGTTFETENVSIDVSVPGVKTERLWVASWSDCRHLPRTKLASGTDVARIAWKGGAPSISSSSPSSRGGPPAAGEPSIVSRARTLAAEMVFGRSSREAQQGQMEAMELDDDGPLAEIGPGMFGQGLTVSQIVAASAVETFENGDFDHVPLSLRTIQQQSGRQMHIVYLSSGAIFTSPLPEPGKAESIGRISMRCAKHKPYENSEYNRSRAFGLDMSDYMPLPPIDFPPPGLLPLVRDIPGHFPSQLPSPARSSSFAFERFLDQGTDVELSVLRMEPCPPYRPWPHLSQPQPSGLRFFPIQSPPLGPVREGPIRRGQGEQAEYDHPDVASQLDPGSFDFDWDSLQGLYGMTYGPWGLEVIYIRSRLLTVHDFSPHEATLPMDKELARPSGPHGPGHTLAREQETGGPYLQETIHWKPEPYVDTAHLQMSKEETAFIRPGCRVIEGVKCTGDANVPRGTISFRAFSRGQDRDVCLPHSRPSSQWANFPPWDGRGVHRRAGPTPLPSSSHAHSPGRVLDCATGRLALEGFVHAGSWKRCSVKITSADEIQVYWGALRKVAVAKRLTAC